MVRLNSASLEWSKQSGSQQHTRKNVFFLVAASFHRLGPRPLQTGLTALSHVHITKST